MIEIVGDILVSSDEYLIDTKNQCEQMDESLERKNSKRCNKKITRFIKGLSAVITLQISNRTSRNTNGQWIEIISII